MFRRKFGFPQVCYEGEGAAGGGSSGGTGSSSAPGNTGGSAPSSPSSASSPSPTPSSDSGTTSPGSTESQTSPSDTSPPGSSPEGDTSSRRTDEFDFSDMDDDVDFDGPAPDETTKKPDDKAKPKVDAKKPPQEAAAPPAPADTQKPDATAKPPEPGPQRTTPQLPSPAEPHRIAEALQAEAPALIEHLAANDFVMTKEDIEALETDMPAALSKFAAKVYHKMAVNMMNQLARTIPAMTSQMAEQRERTQKRQSEFYKAWPDLNPEKHGALVNRYARIYRDANPSATFEQMVQDLGPMVMIGAKVVPGSSQQPVQPQAAPTRTNGRPPSPFRPAMGGPASPPKQADDNEWAGMASSADDE